MSIRFSKETVTKGVSFFRRKGAISSLAAAIRFGVPDPYGSQIYHRGIIARKHLKTDSAPLSFKERIRALYKGYPGDIYCIYGLHEGENEDDYLSDYSRLCAKELNNDRTVLDNKQKWNDFMHDQGFGSYIPATYGLISDGSLISSGYSNINELLESKGSIVIKSSKGGGGDEVYICDYNDGEPAIYGKNESLVPLQNKINEFENYLVTEYCKQADYVDEIYPHSANTIRVLVIDPDGRNAFVAAAAHRIGSKQSGVLDNFSQRGLSVSINSKTGELGKAAERLENEQLVWHESHPDTGAAITGVEIPGWNEIKEQLLTLTSELSGVKYVGWDIVVTDTGQFKIIEGNSYPNPRVLQVHKPLLSNQSVRNFFDENGIKV